MTWRRLLLALAGASIACSSKAQPTCPAGSHLVGGACRVSCSRDEQCLVSETCVASVCTPIRGGGDGGARDGTFAHDAGSEDVASHLDGSTFLDAETDDSGSMDGGMRDSGMPPLFHRAITIDNSANGTGLSNYPVLVSLDTATPIQEGKMRIDGADIGFAGADGTTLSYWIAGKMRTSSTAIWVKVPAIPAASAATIQLTYGDPKASPTSNGPATFLFFADFDSAPLGSDGSQEGFMPQNGTWSVVAGGYRGRGYQEAGSLDRNSVLGSSMYSDVAITAEIMLPSDIMVPGGVDGVYLRASSVSDNYFFGPYDDTKVTIGQYSGGVFTLINEMVKTVSVSTWHEITMTAVGSELRGYFDGALIAMGTSTTFSAGKMGLRTWGTAATFDEVRVRPCTSPEPTTTVGPEH
jgi:hypothetical protein